MIPHERSLVKKFKGRPFALIGVNSDSSLSLYRLKQKEHAVTWRSFRDKASADSGAISDAWRIRSWPSVFFLDHTGVIRHRDVTDTQRMESLLEALVVAAERQLAAKKR
jgi:hypothetical protein